MVFQDVVGTKDMPVVGVVGIAGEVSNNNVHVTNAPHWPIVDGLAISQRFGMQKFTLINDFSAAG